MVEISLDKCVQTCYHDYVNVSWCVIPSFTFKPGQLTVS